MHNFIRTIHDYPKPGIDFKDVTPLLKHPGAFAQCIQELEDEVASEEPDFIAGVEARGFIFGAALALSMGIGFIPVRKKGKLPHKVLRKDYALEYGIDAIEIHTDAVQPRDRVIVLDDLIATGGTAMAAIELLEEAGATVTSAAFVVGLNALRGQDRIEARGTKTHVLLTY